MMSKRVAICAVAQTPYVSNLWQQRFQEMCLDVVEPILEQTGVTYDLDKGIRNIVTCSDDVFDARTISNTCIGDVVGAHFRGEKKVAQDGINAIGYAMACILSGHDDVVLVVGHCKESQPESRDMCTNLAFDPFYCRPLGLDFMNVAALQAEAYMHDSGVTDEQLAKVVVQARKNAAKNPLANATEQVTEKQVMASPMICDPIRELHVYPVSDGALAFLLAAEDRAAEFTDKPVWITGFENKMAGYFPGDRDLSKSPNLEKAADRAYKMAGVKDPAKEFDVIEVNAPYAYQTPMWLDYLGVCGGVKAADWITDGGLEKHHVNPSGGMLAGNPVMLGGMARVAEAVLQLRGEAGDRQVDGARRALAHGTTGAAGQHQAVLVLEKG